MATSGSKSISVTKSDTLKFSWSLSSQSVSGNYSKVSWKLQLISGSYGAIYSSASKKWSVKVNGKSYSGSNTIGIGNNSTKTLASGSTTINHNSDGKKTFSYSFSQTFDITFNGSHVGTKSGSGNGTLTTIPRASSMSVPNITIGSSGTLSISKASSSFTHTITCTFGSYSKTIVSKGTGTSYSFTPPMEWCNALPRSTSGTATYKITTYSGSTAIGSKTYTATLYIPNSVVPTISSVSHAETNLSSGWSGVYVKTKSKIQFRISCAGAYGSTIDSIVTNFDGKLLSGTPSPSATCNSAGEVAYIVIVTDSRGRRASKSGTINVMDYSPPQLINFSAFRCDENGKADDNGERLSISKRFAITQLNNINTNKWKIEYKESGASSYSLLTSGTGYGINDTWISSAVFSVDKAYLLKITVEDSFHVVTREIKIPTAFTLIDFHKSGKGIAFGRVATSPNGAYFGMDVYDKNNKQFRNGLAYYPSGGADANTTLEEVSLCSKNIPVSGFMYVHQIFYNGKTASSNRCQIGIPYDDINSMWHRWYHNGAWRNWIRLLDINDFNHIESGYVTLTPTAENAVTSAAVKFDEGFTSVPDVFVTAESGVPGTITEVSAYNITTSGCTLYMKRVNKVATNVHFLAITGAR